MVATESAPPPRHYADDQGRDALHIMPLSIVPLKTRGLKSARLVKNAQFETMVEIFRDPSTGSGQVPPSLLERVFPSDGEALKADQITISKLAGLSSFDVYSLRIMLRKLDIKVEDESALVLSPAKRAELTEYMKGFTRPLIKYVYGETDLSDVSDISGIIDRLRTPDRAEARKRLDFLSKRLGVEATELPRFLEDYGDIFLSLAYFKKILDEIVPQVETFMEWSDGIKESEMIRRDANTMDLLETIKSQLSQTVSSITGRFETFDNRSKALWNDMSAENFNSFRDLVISNHASIGGVLCGLSLKMDLWRERFPDARGGPAKRADFLRTEIYHGLHRLLQEERMAARALTG